VVLQGQRLVAGSSHAFFRELPKVLYQSKKLHYSEILAIFAGWMKRKNKNRI